jgi:hypothetical protein
MGDNDYIEKRNALIPLAVKFANIALRGLVFMNTAERDDFWNKQFHSKMNLLAYQSGLTTFKE